MANVCEPVAWRGNALGHPSAGLWDWYLVRPKRRISRSNMLDYAGAMNKAVTFACRSSNVRSLMALSCVGFALLGCAEDGSAFVEGLKQGCLDAGRIWNDVAEQCESEQVTSWVMAQSAGKLSFVFDDGIDSSCPTNAIWSGAMILKDVSPETVLFSDMPRHTFSEPTSLFHEQWALAWFTEASGGPPAGVVYWANPPEGRVQAVILQLSTLSPTYDASEESWTHTVCGVDPGEAPRETGNVSEVLQKRPEAEPAACANGFAIALYQRNAWDNWCSIDLSRCRPPSQVLPSICAEQQP